MKILLVEDDPPTQVAIAEALASHHYNVCTAGDGQTAWEFAQQFEYDLILLDIIIPKLDGITLCRRIRSQGYQNPILLLTAKESTADRVIGLDAGADDYLIKPFDLEELLARVRALLRRGKAVGSSVMTWENICFDATHNQVSCSDRILRLTPKEYCLLELFLLNPKRIFSRQAILDRLWDFAQTPGEETVSTHIKSLRQKLKAAGAENPIETIHGLGYRLKTPSYSPQPEDSCGILSDLSESPNPNPDPTPPNPKQQDEYRRQVLANTAQVWEKSKDRFREQLQLLQEASTALNRNQITPQQRSSAQQIAHKLAGSLGIFGFMHGSEIAKDLENLFDTLPLANPQLISQISTLVTQLGEELSLFPAVATPFQPPKYQPLILIVDDDLTLAEQLMKEAITWEFRVEVATDLTVARKVLTQSPPDVILLDLNFPGSQNGFTLLKELMQRIPRIPVLAFTERGNLADRLEVMRLGGCVFLQKPLPTYKILSAISDVLNCLYVPHRNRVLIVDDDVSILEYLSTLLPSFGIEVTTLADPQRFWTVLTTVTPNLLILDLQMAIDGTDLCRTVRSDPQWQNLPILFLSAYPDSEYIERAFIAGADDYISKSIPETELITRILHRLRRVGFEQVSVAGRL